MPSITFALSSIAKAEAVWCTSTGRWRAARTDFTSSGTAAFTAANSTIRLNRRLDFFPLRHQVLQILAACRQQFVQLDRLFHADEIAERQFKIRDLHFETSNLIFNGARAILHLPQLDGIQPAVLIVLRDA